MNRNTESLLTRLRNLVTGDGGFTLLEVLAVMVIVGLLAAITVPQVSKWREKAYITALKTDARNLASAIEADYVDSNQYVTTDAALTAGPLADTKLNGHVSYLVGSYSTDGTAFRFELESNRTPASVVYDSDATNTITVNP